MKLSSGSRPSDKSGGGDPDHWSKNKGGGPRAPPLDPPLKLFTTNSV